MQSFTTSLVLFAATAMAATDWHYKTNGAEWHEVIVDGNALEICKSGTQQSPIDLTKASSASAEGMQVNGYAYKDYPSLTVVNNGHTIKVAGVTDGVLDLNLASGTKETFNPQQFHMHAPSEHTVDGKNYDMELHDLVYNLDIGQLEAVIAVFFQSTEGAADIPIFSNLNLADGVVNADSGYKESTSGEVASKAFLEGLDFSKYWQY